MKKVKIFQMYFRQLDIIIIKHIIVGSKIQPLIMNNRWTILFNYFLAWLVSNITLQDYPQATFKNIM